MAPLHESPQAVKKKNHFNQMIKENITINEMNIYHVPPYMLHSKDTTFKDLHSLHAKKCIS